MPPTPLSHSDLSTVVRLGPVASIDLIIRDARSKVLLGLRNNEPAKGYFFVPGARVWKGERLREAFERILKNEVNYVGSFDQARLLGVFEHFYETNRFDQHGYGTHYIATAYEFRAGDTSTIVADSQHREYSWWDESDILRSDQVHENTKAYFR